MASFSFLGRAAYFALGWCVALFWLLTVVGCASVEEPDHWRDAVKNDKGLIRGI